MPKAFAKRAGLFPKRPELNETPRAERSSMTIGTLAREAKVGVETIRYYQRRRLLPVPHSAGGGVRRYAAEVIDRIRFIKRSQDLGFTLDEIRELMRLEDGGRRDAIRTIAASRLLTIRAKLDDLRRMEGVLSQLVLDCEHANSSVKCPIIAALSEGVA